jgi:ribulose-phosphate 3-epimerase
MMPVEISSSILTADFTRLGEQVNEALKTGVERLHVDVMDGRFVPNLTFGPLLVSAIKPLTEAAGALLEVHLMIEQPENLIPEFARAGAQLIIVHVETCPHLNSTIKQIKALGLRAGVTLNPATPLVTLEEVLRDVDQVLVMSVNPGFGGQTYLPGSNQRISRLRQMLKDLKLDHVDLEVDGGISPANAAQVVSAGANVLVVGSAIFNNEASVAENITSLRNAISGEM